jgi:hypothetical protein
MALELETRVIALRRPVQIVLQRADARRFEFLELAGVDGPEERPHGHEAARAQRHQHVQDRHARTAAH